MSTLCDHADLVVYPLVHFLLVVQHHEGLWRNGVTIEDEAQVSSLAFHVCEVDESSVQPEQDKIHITLTNTDD